LGQELEAGWDEVSEIDWGARWEMGWEVKSDLDLAERLGQELDFLV